MKKYEFILWHNCNNKCKFCPLDKTGKFDFTEQTRARAMEECNKYIKSDKFEFGSDAMVIGGEIFIDGEVTYGLFNNIIEHMKSGRIRNFMFNSNLLYEDLQDLAAIIEYFTAAGLLDRISFTTSYDSSGRFTEESKELFLDNLGIITYSFPNLTVGVNMILTKDFCDDIISGRFVLSKFMEEYRVRVNLIPYININSDLAPDLDIVFKTMSLIKLDLSRMKTPDYTYWEDMYKILNRSELPIVLEFDGESYIDKSISKLSCGHGSNFADVFDGKCFLCELKKFVEVFNQNL